MQKFNTKYYYMEQNISKIKIKLNFFFYFYDYIDKHFLYAKPRNAPGIDLSYRFKFTNS